MAYFRFQTLIDLFYRAQSLEASLKLLNEQMEVQRGRDDGMIETLRVTISKLENQLSADRKKWQSKEWVTM